MTTLLVLGVKGSPGTTTTALLLAGCIEGSLLVDGDRSGGVIAIRHGLTREPGLSTLAADRSTGPAVAESHLQSIGDVAVLVGPDHGDRGTALWARAGSKLTSDILALGRPTVIDGGRTYRTETETTLYGAADLRMIVTRSDSEGLVAITNLPENLEAGLVVVETGPHTAAEVGEASNRVVLGTLPFDRRTASAINGTNPTWSRRSVGRSPLGRAARTLARHLTSIAETREPVR